MQRRTAQQPYRSASPLCMTATITGTAGAETFKDGSRGCRGRGHKLTIKRGHAKPPWPPINIPRLWTGHSYCSSHSHSLRPIPPGPGAHTALRTVQTIDQRQYGTGPVIWSQTHAGSGIPYAMYTAGCSVQHSQSTGWVLHQSTGDASSVGNGWTSLLLSRGAAVCRLRPCSTVAVSWSSAQQPSPLALYPTSTPRAAAASCRWAAG